MPPDELDIETWVARSRAEQGLGPQVTDPAVLDRIAALAMRRNKNGADPQAGSDIGSPPPSPKGGARRAQA